MANAVFQYVTDRFIAELEKGIVPWQRPWHGLSDMAVSYDTGKPYSLLNQFLLGRPGEWLTLKRIKELGGKRKEGAKPEMCTFYKTYLKGKDDESDTIEDEKTQLRFVLRYYLVYHIDDCEGIQSKRIKTEQIPSLSKIERAEQAVIGYTEREPSLHLEVKQSNRAYYSPVTDTVVVPCLDQYDIAEEYYSTIFHELTHSTGHPSRLDRKQSMHNHFGDEKYSREELVAEIGSAMCLNLLDINCKKAFRNSVGYVQSWLNKLKDDNKMIVWASSRAEKAAKYILNIND